MTRVVEIVKHDLKDEGHNRTRAFANVLSVLNHENGSLTVKRVELETADSPERVVTVTYAAGVWLSCEIIEVD